MTDTTIDTGLICTCCLMVLANGDASGCDSPDDPREHPFGLMGLPFGGDPVTGGEHDHACAYSFPDSECDYGCEVIDFSSARCDGCGSYLAGTRHVIRILSRDEN